MGKARMDSSLKFLGVEVEEVLRLLQKQCNIRETNCFILKIVAIGQLTMQYNPETMP